jgi:hypothetical protein
VTCPGERARRRAGERPGPTIEKMEIFSIICAQPLDFLAVPEPFGLFDLSMRDGQ